MEKNLTDDFKNHLNTFPGFYESTFNKFYVYNIKNNNNSSGYYAAAFYDPNEGEMVIANRGTETDSLFHMTWDLWADGGFVFGKIKQQFLDSFKFVSKILGEIQTFPQLKNKVKKVRLTGHSLGGGLATLQFLYFYGGKYSSLLDGVTTFEAPGVGMLITSGLANMLEDIFHAREDQININRRIMVNGAKNLLKQKYIIEYGTHLDFIYNDLPHIGQTINPLICDGTFEESNPLTEGFTVGAFHPIHTYKKYDFSGGNINTGNINITNFFKVIVPILKAINLSNKQIIQYFYDLYDDKFSNTKVLENFLINGGIDDTKKNLLNGQLDENSRFRCDLLKREGSFDTLYQYGIIFSFLKRNGLKKSHFLGDAKQFMSKHRSLA